MLNLHRLSLRFRIIITFMTIVIALVFIISRISYITVKEIYLNQLASQVNLSIRHIASQLNLKYLEYLIPESDTTTAQMYYQSELIKQIRGIQVDEIFLFRNDLNILYQTSKNLQQMDPLPALILNRKEISKLHPGQTVTSEPFKSQAGEWFLWGFYRIDQDHYLGIRESADRLARVDGLAHIFWLIGTGAVIVTLLAGWFLARAISKPIENLVKCSEELGKGNFQYSVPDNIQGELRVLSSAMERMRIALQKHNSEKEEILAQIAHEIRNPLGSIELMAGLLKEDLQKQQLDAVYAGKILEEIHKLKILVTEYLNYSRPIQAVPKWVNVKESVKEMEDLLYYRLQEKQVSLVYSNINLKIWFDENHFRQILMNLITNSIDVSPAGGRVFISTQRKETNILVGISDEGSGINEDHLAKIFNPFFSTKDNGIGLGLAICKKLCNENGANIYAENNRDKGCTFYIEIKVNQ
jgi:signal transduction histidine kinase